MRRANEEAGKAGKVVTPGLPVCKAAAVADGSEAGGALSPKEEEEEQKEEEEVLDLPEEEEEKQEEHGEDEEALPYDGREAEIKTDCLAERVVNKIIDIGLSDFVDDERGEIMEVTRLDTD